MWYVEGHNNFLRFWDGFYDVERDQSRWKIQKILSAGEQCFNGHIYLWCWFWPVCLRDQFCWLRHLCWVERGESRWEPSQWSVSQCPGLLSAVLSRPDQSSQQDSSSVSAELRSHRDTLTQSEKHWWSRWHRSDHGTVCHRATTTITMNIASSTFVLLVSLARLSDEFNLETRAPVVKTGGQYENSFFGFSVAQHQTRDGESLLLIGAPQDKNLQPGTNHSGALYQCPVSSSTRDCVQVVTDGKRHNSGQYHGIYDGRIRDLKTPISAEIKDGQWLGVAVSSQGRLQHWTVTNLFMTHFCYAKKILESSPKPRVFRVFLKYLM